MSYPATVLCVIDRRRNPLTRLIRRGGHLVIESFTVDQAVAICASNNIDIVVLDQEFFVETDGWSVAQSIKLVKPETCVVLVTRATQLTSALPRDVDAVVPHSEPAAVLATLEEMATGAWHKRSGKPMPSRLNPKTPHTSSRLQ